MRTAGGWIALAGDGLLCKPGQAMLVPTNRAVGGSIFRSYSRRQPRAGKAADLRYKVPIPDVGTSIACPPSRFHRPFLSVPRVSRKRGGQRQADGSPLRAMVCCANPDKRCLSLQTRQSLLRSIAAAASRQVSARHYDNRLQRFLSHTRSL